jgi:hypothetical protein
VVVATPLWVADKGGAARRKGRQSVVVRLIQVRLGKRVEAVEAGGLVRQRWAPRSQSWAVAVMASVRQRRRRQQQRWLPLLQRLVKEVAPLEMRPGSKVRARWQPMATLRGMQGD